MRPETDNLVNAEAQRTGKKGRWYSEEIRLQFLSPRKEVAV